MPGAKWRRPRTELRKWEPCKGIGGKEPLISGRPRSDTRQLAITPARVAAHRNAGAPRLNPHPPPESWWARAHHSMTLMRSCSSLPSKHRGRDRIDFDWKGVMKCSFLSNDTFVVVPGAKRLRFLIVGDSDLRWEDPSPEVASSQCHFSSDLA